MGGCSDDFVYNHYFFLGIMVQFWSDKLFFISGDFKQNFLKQIFPEQKVYHNCLALWCEPTKTTIFFTSPLREEETTKNQNSKTFR